MSKGARIRKKRADKTDRRNTVVSKETSCKRMANPGNRIKAQLLGKKKTG